MVESIRNVEKALGDGLKIPRPSEMKNKEVARKSLVAVTSIMAGEVFSEDNLAVMRPGAGMSPYCYWELLGCKAVKDFSEGEIVIA